MSKEVRYSNLEFRKIEQEQDNMILEGYAVTFGQPTCLYEIEGIKYYEVVDKNAFINADMKDCCLKYNHQDNVPILARVRGGSLELTVDDYGLYFKAKLFNITSARDVYELVKQGGLDKCSFAFTINEDEYNRDTRTRTIKSIKKLFDVSVVDIPAYDSTSVSARSFFELENEKERKELENLNLRKQLIIKTML